MSKGKGSIPLVVNGKLLIDLPRDINYLNREKIDNGQIVVCGKTNQEWVFNNGFFEYIKKKREKPLPKTNWEE